MPQTVTITAAATTTTSSTTTIAATVAAVFCASTSAHLYRSLLPRNLRPSNRSGGCLAYRTTACW
jgi:hypothetical protein